MKRYLTILSLLLITTINLAKANTIADTVPKTKVVQKKAVIPKPKPVVWGKPKVLNAKDDAARRKAEEASFKPVKKHYYHNGGKP